MECENICNWLCAYLDKELGPETREHIEEHLASCPACRRELEIHRSMKLLIQQKLICVSAPDYLRKKVLTELERAEEYRESGIQVLDLVRWGSHIAQLYDAKDELIEVLVPYLARGLEQNELCMWVVADILESEAEDAFKKEIPGVQEYIDAGQLQILSYKDWYLPGGRFNGQVVLNNGFKKYQDALSRGYSGLRVTGTTSWLEKKDWDSFMAYENYLNNTISNFKLLVVCTYKNEYTQDKILDVMNTHKYVICKIDSSWKLRKK